jgi:Ca2+-transporting ATPase
MAGSGLRVLGVASARFGRGELPPDQHEFEFEFVGLVGFEDPVRPHVADSVAECYGAGLRVIMITGDYPATAQNIARQVGLRGWEEVITGAELDAMDRRELEKRIRTAGIFARVVPEQKLRIVNALKSNREVVVMTGDGVNDAPALKAADIGIAMGARGTEVAREASAIVLLDDDFSSIVQAVRMGRRIFDNLKKAMSYIVSVHVPIAGMALLPVALGWPVALFPAHIAFLELIIDPVCSIVFEAESEEENVMRRPPRKAGAPLFSRKTILSALLQGFVVLAIVAGMYRLAPAFGAGEDEARALAFTTLVLCNFCLIVSDRSFSRPFWEGLYANRALVWVALGASMLLLLAVYVPFFETVFRFAPMSLEDFGACLLAGAAALACFELLKLAGGGKAAGA